MCSSIFVADWTLNLTCTFGPSWLVQIGLFQLCHSNWTVGHQFISQTKKIILKLFRKASCTVLISICCGDCCNCDEKPLRSHLLIGLWWLPLKSPVRRGISFWNWMVKRCYWFRLKLDCTLKKRFIMLPHVLGGRNTTIQYIPNRRCIEAQSSLHLPMEFFQRDWCKNSQWNPKKEKYSSMLVSPIAITKQNVVVWPAQPN